MASTNVTQLRRLVLRRWDATTSKFSTFELGPDSLGQDTVATVNITPRTVSRNSSLGTTETPLEGTYDSFSGSVTFLMDTIRILAMALNRWNKATYAGATDDNGNMIGSQLNLCGDGKPVSVILQGVCDDGSSADVELPRCFPATDGDIEFGGTETPSVTLQLHPQPYNPTLHADDGLPQCDYRFGDYSLTEKMRLNATTGEYAAVTPATGD